MDNICDELLDGVTKELMILYSNLSDDKVIPNYAEHINVCIDNLIYCLKYTTDNSSLELYRRDMALYKLPILKDRKYEIISKAKERQVELALARLERDFR